MLKEILFRYTDNPIKIQQEEASSNSSLKMIEDDTTLRTEESGTPTDADFGETTILRMVLINAAMAQWVVPTRHQKKWSNPRLYYSAFGVEREY
jgi:hypothetical protein